MAFATVPTTGVGLTVMVKVDAGPVHVPVLGVTVMVLITGFEVALVAV